MAERSQAATDGAGEGCRAGEAPRVDPGADAAMLRGALAADDARLEAAAVRVWGEHTHGCDTPEWLADEVLHARESRAVAQQQVAELTRERDAWKGTAECRQRSIDADTRRLRGQQAEIERLQAEVDRLNSECKERAADQSRLRADLASAQAEIERLRGELATDRAVCLCGCPLEQHESRAEDGESCGHDDHECIRVPPAVLAIVQGLRGEARTFERLACQRADDAERLRADLAARDRALADASRSALDMRPDIRDAMLALLDSLAARSRAEKRADSQPEQEVSRG